MKSKIAFIFLIGILSTAIVSCKQKGCMDPDAKNYDQKAEKENSSCEYACDGVTCENGGTGISNGATCSCRCATGYEGDRCQTKTITKLVGVYNSSVACSFSASSNPTFTIAASSSFVDRINITGGIINGGCPLYSASNYTFYATVSGNSISIPSQPTTLVANFGGINYSVSGNGTINATNSNVVVTLNLVYSPNDVCYSDCAITLTKI